MITKKTEGGFTDRQLKWVWMAKEENYLVFFLALLARSFASRSPMFSKTTKRKMKLRPCTGYHISRFLVFCLKNSFSTTAKKCWQRLWPFRMSGDIFYFGGARSKGFATLRNVSKLQFFAKIGHAKL